MYKQIGVMIPNGPKKYTIEDWKAVMLNPKQQKLKTPGEAYDGLEDAKKVNVASKGKEPQMVWIAMDLMSNEEELLIQMLKEQN